MATADKLQQIIDNNESIIFYRDMAAQSIRDKGVSVPFGVQIKAFPSYIDQIPQGGAIEPITTITPTEARQEIRPSEGYDGIAGVDVEAIQTEQVEITPTEEVQVVVPTAGKYFNEVTVPAIPTPEPSEFFIRKLVVKQGQGFVEELIPIKAGQVVDLGIGEDVAEAEELNSDWNPALTWQAWSCAIEVVDNTITAPADLDMDVYVDSVYKPTSGLNTLLLFNFNGLSVMETANYADIATHKADIARIWVADGVTTVDRMCESANRVTSISLPLSVTNARRVGMSAPSLKYVNNPPNNRNSDNFVYNSKAAKRVILPFGFTAVPLYFMGNTQSIAQLWVPETVSRINGNAFSNSGIQKVRMSQSVSFIDGSIFSQCGGFDQLLDFSATNVIPTGFANYSGLTFVRLTANVTTISNGAFQSINSLKVIICESTTPPTLINLTTLPAWCVILVPEESLQAYLDATNWSVFGAAGRILPDTAENRLKFGVK